MLICKQKLKYLIRGLLVSSAIITIIIVGITAKSPSLFNSATMTPAANFVLSRYPALYNPLHSTFISRVKHIDAGYYNDQPAIYEDADGNVTKILMNNETTREVLQSLQVNKEDKKVLDKIVKNNINESEFRYINIPNNLNIKVKKVYPKTFEPAKQPDLYKLGQGIYMNEGEFCWLQPNAGVIISNDGYTQSGMKISFYGYAGLAEANNQGITKTTIYINNIKIREVNILDTGSYDIIINSEEIPKPQDGLYKIQLLTNGSFNPSKTGESKDNRDLSIQLFYIGKP